MVKQFLVCIVAVTVPLFCYADFTGKVIKVSDGDTLEVLVNGNQSERVRLENIDAPESSQAYGQKSRSFLNSMVYGKQVFVCTNKMDLYQRHIGTVMIGSVNINQQMVQNGYAWAFREYLTDSRFISYETQARNARLGLWQDPNPIYPSNYRKSKKGF